MTPKEYISFKKDLENPRPTVIDTEKLSGPYHAELTPKDITKILGTAVSMTDSQRVSSLRKMRPAQFVILQLAALFVVWDHLKNYLQEPQRGLLKRSIENYILNFSNIDLGKIESVHDIYQSGHELLKDLPYRRPQSEEEDYIHETASNIHKQLKNVFMDLCILKSDAMDQERIMRWPYGLIGAMEACGIDAESHKLADEVENGLRPWSIRPLPLGEFRRRIANLFACRLPIKDALTAEIEL